MRKFVLCCSLGVFLLTGLSQAGARPLERSDRDRYSGSSIDLGVGGFGISFGNSHRFNGLRFNLVDSDVEEINGLNVTLWKPEENTRAIIRGISLGLIAPQARELSGISIGGIAVVAEGSLSGISVGGIAAVSEGSLSGIAVGGIASVAEGSMSGISIGGLAAVAEGSASGIMLGGLAAVAEGSASGIMVGGLASVAEGSMSGISIGGLASVAEREFSGIQLAGLAAVSDGDMRGISAAGGSVIADGDISGISIGAIGTFGRRERSEDGDEIEIDFSYNGIQARNARWITLHGIDIAVEERLGGLGAAGISVRAGEIAGIALAGILVKAQSLSGLSAGAVNYFDDYQAGLSIGLVNIARELKGIQLGVINISKNNPSPFKVLPIINAHF